MVPTEINTQVRIMVRRALLFILTATVFCHLQAADKEMMAHELGVIKNSFAVKYAPFEWKRECFGWDLEEQINLVAQQLKNTPSATVKDFQKYLHGFFISMCDYHVQDHYYSTEKASLPFAVKSANGHYFITQINEPILLTIHDGSLTTMMQPGDELLLFNGQPVQETIAAICEREVGNSASKSSQGVAEELLTVALGSLGHQVPQGEVALTCKLVSGELASGTVSWDYHPEFIGNKAIKLNPFQAYAKMMVNPLLSAIRHERQTLWLKKTQPIVEVESNAFRANDLIDRESIRFGAVLWSDNNMNYPFKSYIYQLPDSSAKIGYIRLDDYAPSDDMSVINDYVDHLTYLISFMQLRTDALLIDQVSNPGGYLLYLYGIASLLSEQPMELPKHRRTLTQEDVYSAYETINSMANGAGLFSLTPRTLLYGYSYDIEFDLAQLSESVFILDQWDENKILTDPFPAYGIEKLQPNPRVQYTKPIMVLVDSQDYSGGDFFPALLQDNGRATIFGEQTAGAGGVVEKHTHPNLFGLASYSYTSTIAFRLNGQPLENLGVTPDIHYEVTEKDLLHGYQDYIAAVNAALQALIPQKNIR